MSPTKLSTSESKLADRDKIGLQANALEPCNSRGPKAPGCHLVCTNLIGNSLGISTAKTQ